VADWLRSHDLSIDDIANWAIHPGGPKILDATQRALQLPEEKMAPSRDTLRQHGNMSSPTVLAILETITKRENPTPTVALAFGPGLSIEAMLLI
jgi:predicted naringenin-chalcone synthase